MSGLPRELAPWRQSLELLPLDLAGVVGNWLRRLAPMVGSLRLADDTRDGEPDGFRDLTHRGRYERLLVSEWLLAEEAPEEFTRRAAVGEHLFLQLARRQPRGALRSVVLFDAGPDQLGAPRLVHIALAILFAERATAAGADFRWGVLQEDRPPWTEINEASIRALLAARTMNEATPEDAERWREQLAPAKDLWLVCGDLIGGDLVDGGLVEDDWQSVQIQETAALKSEVLEVQVRRAGRALVSAELELPEEQAALQLIRNPFKAAPSSPVSTLPIQLRGTPVLSAAGNALIVYGEDRELFSYHVPKLGNPAGKNGRLILPGKLVAANRVGKRWLTVVMTRDGLTVHGAGTGKHRREGHIDVYVPLDDLVPATVEPGDPVPPCFNHAWIENGETRHGLVFMDKLGKVYWIDPFERAELRELWERAVVLARPNGRLAVVVSRAGPEGLTDEPGLAIFNVGPRRGQPPVGLVAENAPLAQGIRGNSKNLGHNLQAFFGAGGHQDVGMLALRGDGFVRRVAGINNWLLLWGGDPREILVPNGALVFGASYGRNSQPALLAVDPDRRSVARYGMTEPDRRPNFPFEGGFREDLFRASEDIVAASSSPSRTVVALRLASGEVQVLTTKGEMLRQLRLEND